MTQTVVSNRTLSKIVGFLFLAQMLTAVAGNILIASLTSAEQFPANIADSHQTLGAGAILMILCFIAVIAISILLYPILKECSQAVALSYLATRFTETVIQLIGVVALLTLIPLSQEYLKAESVDIAHLSALAESAINTHWYAYHSAMIFLGFGSLFFCHTLFRHALIPKLLAALGLVGYFILATSSALTIIGLELGLYVTLPVFFFEILLGLWLMVKGFNLSGDVAGETA